MQFPKFSPKNWTIIQSVIPKAWQIIIKQKQQIKWSPFKQRRLDASKGKEFNTFATNTRIFKGPKPQKNTIKIDETLSMVRIVKNFKITPSNRLAKFRYNNASDG